MQVALVVVTGSMALLADTIHNVSDAATALPLWAAFTLSRRKPSSRFTYGLGRMEELTGLIIVAAMLATGIAAAYASIGDQLDMQYWDQVNGTTTWKDAIAAVKVAHPKPE